MRENTRVEGERRRSAEDGARTAEEKLVDEGRAAQTSKEEAEQAKMNVEEARRNEAEEKRKRLEWSRILTLSPTVFIDPTNLHCHVARISTSFPNPSTTPD